MLSLVAPFAALLLMPAADGGDAVPAALAADVSSRSAAEPGYEGALAMLVRAYREDVANQVRIQQNFQMRIIARPGPMPFDMPLDDPRASGPRYIEAKIGKCIASGNFSAMTPGVGRRLFLFTRDNRIFSALLERACEARDFYSGFYLARAADAKLCVDRDRLLSRSGVNCRLKQIRELIEVGD